jgi:murein DD-endopeptidase MepM/ murein hydrolase activator NlpD
MMHALRHIRRWSSRRSAVALATAVATALSVTTVSTAPAEAATRQDLETAFAAAGFDWDKGLDAADYLEAARTFGVDTGSRIDGSDLDHIVAAGWARSIERLAVAGIGIGEAPDPSDITDAAVGLGVPIGDELSAADVEAVLRAGRARVKRTLEAAGLDVGQTVDVTDLVRTSKVYGVKIGARLDPQDTRRILDEAWLRVEAPLLATANAVSVHTPSPRPVYVGFHQASSGRSTPMRAALGRKLPSRGRGTAGTSAVDVAMVPGDPVRAPVTGRVAAVEAYTLYGKTPDYRLRFIPDDNPSMLVTVLHVTDPKVRPGQRVVGGVDLIAGGARQLPFVSQIDVNGGKGFAHVHVELRPR